MDFTKPEEDGFPTLEPPAFLRRYMGPTKCECVSKLLSHIGKLLATKDDVCKFSVYRHIYNAINFVFLQ